MTNPVLAKSEAFAPGHSFVQPQYQTFTPQGYPNTPQGYPSMTPPVDAYGNPVTGQYPQSGFVQQPYAAPGQYPPAAPYAPQQSWAQSPVPQTTNQKVMTLDDVLTKTAVTLGLVIVMAALTMSSFRFFGATEAVLGSVALVGIICGVATIIFALVAAARRKFNAGLAIAFAILEGIFVGAFSLIFEVFYSGIVMQAVVATFVVAALVLVAFKFTKFRQTAKMQRVLSLCLIGFLAVTLVNFVLTLCGVNMGMFPAPGQPVTWLAWAAAAVGTVLAVWCLLSDFQFVEQGIANQAPASESWRAAYGLTVTLVWLYTDVLRILSYLRR